MADPVDRVRSRVLPVVVAIGAAGAFTLGAFGTAYLSDVSVSSLTRDVAATMQIPWYVGSFSWLGVLIWFGGSGIALAASFKSLPPHRSMLRALGVFGMILAIDDGFALHDYTLPQLFGDSVEHVIYVVYAVVAVAFAVAWFRVLVPLARDFALIAALFLGASVLGDVVGAPSFAEDALKFIGVVAWAGVAVVQAGHAVPRATPAGIPSTADG